MNVRLSWSLGKIKIYIVEKGGFFEDMGTSKELSERLGLPQRSINEIASKTRRGLMPMVEFSKSKGCQVEMKIAKVYGLDIRII